MSLLKGRIEAEQASAAFRLSPDILLPLPREYSASAGTEAILGIRPEYVSISEPGTGFAAKVVVVEPLGSETQITLSAGDHAIVAMTRARSNLQPDETVWIQPQVEHVRLFGADGRRLYG